MSHYMDGGICVFGVIKWKIKSLVWPYDNSFRSSVTLSHIQVYLFNILNIGLAFMVEYWQNFIVLIEILLNAFSMYEYIIG